MNLIRRSLTYYWRSNAAVVLGVATAVTVLAGALIVGDSVRGSLRDLVLQRLGRTDYAVLSTGFFQESLAESLRREASAAGFAGTCPIVILPGLVTNQTTGQRSLGVQVYGVDDRFWRFHGATPRAPGEAGPREVLLSETLAREIGAEPGGTVLVRVQKPSDIPLDSLHGRKDDVGSTLRATFGGVMPASGLGDFSLQPQQGEVRAAFVPLSRLQRDLNLRGEVNAILVSGGSGGGAAAMLEALVRKHAAIEDVGLQVRSLDGGTLSVEAGGTLIDRPRAEAIEATAQTMNLAAAPVFTYLVDSITIGDRTIPYSLVSAVTPDHVGPTLRSGATSRSTPPIVLNEWAAADLKARTGDTVRLDYLAWEDPGLLQARSATFQLAAIVPIAGAAADRNLVPSYPGVTDSDSLADWDPPFPIDLGRIRDQDEEYWRQHRTTPKAFIPLETGQSLWQSRHGSLTSIRILPGSDGKADPQAFSAALRSRLDPLAIGLAVRSVKDESLAASQGATDFGEYFTYFSFFLVVAALLLAVLFFKLGIEQRAREVGLLRAVGFNLRAVRRLFVTEGLVLSVAGGLLGTAGAIGYGALLMLGLRTWWVESVGTTALTLHVSPLSLAAGLAGGIVGAIVSIWWTLRSLRHVSERSLLAGRVTTDLQSVSKGRSKIQPWAAMGLGVLGMALIGAGALGLLGAAGAFFGAGASLLAASLFGISSQLHARPQGRAYALPLMSFPLVRLGIRNASYRPARSVLSIAVVAAAVFIVVSVGAFRREGHAASTDRRSGTGGYALLVNTLLPIINAPDSAEGRELLGLSNRPDIAFTALRVRPGDDASCLNLYQPRDPRIVGVDEAFVAAQRFAFAGSLAESDEDRANPWRLLERPLADAIPAIADANSMTYVLHKSLGDDIVISVAGIPQRLRLVAALRDSLLQGELVISEAHFVRLFPEYPGYRMMLVDAPPEAAADVATTIEDRLSDFGADALPAGARLAEFHRVENTYLSTFQTLGGLGLLLGTLGLAAVLLRNVLERRRELALLGALGYRRSHILTLVMAENIFLLASGVFVGTACALIAVAPAALEHGGRVPAGAGVALLVFAVLAAGVLSSFAATRLTLRTQLLGALKAE